MVKPKRKRINFKVILILLVVLVAGSWFGYRHFQKPPMPQITYDVTKGNVEIAVSEVGILEPIRKVEIKSKAAGRILELPVDAGDKVVKDQLLALIDPSDLMSTVAQANAQVVSSETRLKQNEISSTVQNVDSDTALERAKNALKSAEISLTQTTREVQTQPQITKSNLQEAIESESTARQDLDQFKSVTMSSMRIEAATSLNQADTSLDEARKNLVRQKNLLDKGFVSQREVDSAKSTLASSEASWKNAKQKSDTIEKQIATQLQNYESKFKVATASLARTKEQAKRDELKWLDLEAKKTAYKDAQQALLNAKIALLSKQSRKQELVADKTNIVASRSSYKDAQTKLHETVIRAPFDGTITQRYIESGELVTSGVSNFSSGMSLLQLADLSKIKVNLLINEVDVRKVRVGLPVQITLDAIPGRVFPARVETVAPAAQVGADGNVVQGGVIKFPVRVVIDNPDPMLRSGMSCKCKILVQYSNNVIRLQNDAVKMLGPNMGEVMVVKPTPKDPQPKPTKRKVKLGLVGDNFIEIKSGLKPGEKVVPQPFMGPPRQGLDFGPGGH